MGSRDYIRIVTSLNFKKDWLSFIWLLASALSVDWKVFYFLSILWIQIDSCK